MTFFLYRTVSFYMVANLWLFFSLYFFFGKKRWFFLLLPWFLCMGAFPLVFHWLPDSSALQNAFSALGTFWHPVAFFGTIAFAVRAVLLLGARLLCRLIPSVTCYARAASRLGLLFFVLCACIFCYGIYEVRALRTTHVDIMTDKLSAGAKSVRVVFASDLHVGPQTGRALLKRTVDRILEARPDVVLLGGDIVDDALQGTRADFLELSRLRAPLGVFAVLGNHDALGDYRRVETLLQRSGIEVLSERIAEAGSLTLVGVDDPVVSKQKPGEPVALQRLLQQTDAKDFTIVMAHRPILLPEHKGLFDLQLSGHSHGGQTFLLQSYCARIYGVEEGLSYHPAGAKGTYMFVTTGTGFSKLPIRLSVPPEIVVIDIKPLS